MVRIFLLTALVWSQIGHAAQEGCETLLEGKSVRNAVANILDHKLGRKVVLGLKGYYDYMSKSDEVSLRRLFSTHTKPGTAQMVLTQIKKQSGRIVAEIQISGTGKSVLRSLIDLNAKPPITRATAWKAWHIPVPENEEYELPPPAPITEEQMRERFLIPLVTLDFSIRTGNSLKNENLWFVGDLVHRYPAELLRVPNFGRKSLKEVQVQLHDLGLTLGMNPGGWPPEQISPVLLQIAGEYRPKFEISDWSASNREEAKQYMEYLLRRRAVTKLLSNGNLEMLIFPLEMFQTMSKEQALREFDSERFDEGDTAIIDNLREQVKERPATRLSATLGPSGFELLKQAARDKVPLRIETPDQLEPLVFVPRPTSPLFIGPPKVN